MNIEDARSNAASPTDYTPSLLRALKRAVSDIYDHIGLVAIASFIWFVTLIPTIFLGLPAFLNARSFGAVMLVLFGWHVLTAPVTAGVFHLAGNVVKRESPAAADIPEGARLFLVPAWKLAAAELFITTVLIADIVFFYGLLLSTRNMLFIPLAAISFYALIFWTIMVTLQWPLLIEQRPPTLKILSRSFLLVADNLVFTTGAWFAIILLSILCLSPGMALLYMGAAGVISTSVLRELFRKYGLAAIEPDEVPDKGWHIGDYR